MNELSSLEKNYSDSIFIVEPQLGQVTVEPTSRTETENDFLHPGHSTSKESERKSFIILSNPDVSKSILAIDSPPFWEDYTTERKVM